MKKAISFLLFISLIFLNSNCFAGEKFISGIWKKGSNVDGPKPEQSKYLLVDRGGFLVSKNGVRYFLVLKVIRPVKKILMVHARFQKPFDTNNPLVQKRVLNVMDDSLFLIAGPIKGLEINTDYGVEIDLYDTDKNNIVIVDTLRQDIRSYVDTTESKVYLKGDWVK